MTVDFEIRRNENPVPAAERAALMANPGFGRVFTDHMVTIRYADGKGWYDARVEARGPIATDPATAVLHYAQEIFEGLKAYHCADGQVRLFRPDANAARFRSSAERMAMAQLPEELFLGALHELIKLDREWIPTTDEASLYLRPFMYASEVFLGVKPSVEYLFVVIAGPVGSYFTRGVQPVNLWVSPDFTRAALGGTGAAKCGGNYAAGLAAKAAAVAQGCDDVVYLDAAEHRYVEELSGMNVFFVYDDGTLVTPPLSGTILPGITRDSIITLARDQGLRVVERPYAIDEWQADAASGRLREAFACGTAAVITPIGTVRWPGSLSQRSEVDARQPGGEFEMSAGPVTAGLRQQLVDIQRGRVADPHGWVHLVP